VPTDRRRASERRRQQDRRARLSAIQATHDDLRAIIERNSTEVERLKAEQRLQLIRIAQIQQEIDELKKAR
jgi:uncharacterized protein YlxW (UPF0749 family)